MYFKVISFTLFLFFDEIMKNIPQMLHSSKIYIR